MTIKQLADELGMTKQGIRRYLVQLPPELAEKNTNGIVQIKPEAVRKIREMIQEKRKPVTGNVASNEPVTLPVTNSEVTTLIAMLQKELDTKNATIESQSRQLEQAHQSIQELTAALSRQQYLHAGTIHQQLTDGAEQGEAAAPGPVDLAAPPRSPEEQPKKRLGVFARIFGNK